MSEEISRLSDSNQCRCLGPTKWLNFVRKKRDLPSYVTDSFYTPPEKHDGVVSKRCYAYVQDRIVVCRCCKAHIGGVRVRVCNVRGI